MAADWIKMRTDLAGDPAVIRIRRATGLDADAVVGKLHRLWSWADAHTADGFAAGLDAEWVDEFAGCTGFAAPMAAAGWLEVTADGVRFVNFERHNGQPAKVRALRKTRMERFRGARSATDAPPEKRREEKKDNPPPPAAAEDREPWMRHALDRWVPFRDQWNATPGAEPWKPLTPPSGSAWLECISNGSWREQYPLALAKLAGLRRFKNPVTLTQFLSDGWVGRIVAGDFDGEATPAVRHKQARPAESNF